MSRRCVHVANGSALAVFAVALCLFAGAAASLAAPPVFRQDRSVPNRASAEEIHARTEAILASDEFAIDVRSEQAMRLIERVANWLLGFLERFRSLFEGFFAWSRGAGVLGSITYYLVLGLACAALVYLIVRLILWILGRVRHTGLEPTYQEAPALTEPILTGPPPITALRENAKKALADGDIRLAIRYLFLAYIAYLHALKVLVFDPRRTNGEYLRGIEPGTVHANNLLGAVERFERAWYGALPGTEDDVAALDALSLPAVEVAHA